MVIACAITLYFFRQNLLGIHESSDKALKIMIATTVMAVVMLVWCGVTLCVHGPVNRVPLAPDLNPRWSTRSSRAWIASPARSARCGSAIPRRAARAKRSDNGKPVPPKINEATGEQEDPLGFMASSSPRLAKLPRSPATG